MTWVSDRSARLTLESGRGSRPDTLVRQGRSMDYRSVCEPGRSVRRTLVRIEKAVLDWDLGGNGGAGDWALKRRVRYVYDGWNVIAELDSVTTTVAGVTGSGSASVSVTRLYAWGVDLSGNGGTTGAGGVGGLVLAQTRVSSQVPSQPSSTTPTTVNFPRSPWPRPTMVMGTSWRGWTAGAVRWYSGRSTMRLGDGWAWRRCLRVLVEAARGRRPGAGCPPWHCCGVCRRSGFQRS